MRTVDDFARIRQAHRDGLSAREIATQFGVGRGTVRKALQHADPPPYTLDQPRPAPVFGPFRPFADTILAEDETAPRKQRHTASQIHRRLVAAKRSSLWSIGRASAPKPTLGTSPSTSPMAGVRSRS